MAPGLVAVIALGVLVIVALLLAYEHLWWLRVRAQIRRLSERAERERARR